MHRECRAFTIPYVHSIHPDMSQKNIAYVGTLVAVAAVTFAAGFGLASMQYSTELARANAAQLLQQPSVVKDVQQKTSFAGTGATIQERQTQFARNMSLFWDVYSRLLKYHPNATSVTDQEYVYGAIKGLAASVGDPYTYFLTPEESNEFINVDLNGELQGIGAELTESEEGVLKVASVLPGTPAEKGGLLAGDIIYKINDDIIGPEMTVFEAVKRIRGPKGTQVRVTILREGVDEPKEYTITRDDIKVPSVEYSDKEGGNIAYIRLNKFSESTADELQSTIYKILLKPPRAVILDLRNNGGGYLDAAVDVVSAFQKEGKVVTIDDKKRGNGPKTMDVNGRAQLGNVPMVVLVNEQSASASEIVAGALQDNKRAHLIGMDTYGKGSVQELENLADGSSLRITIAKWFTPNGTNVEKTAIRPAGIHPDEKIPLTAQELKEGKDKQLDRAISYLKEVGKW